MTISKYKPMVQHISFESFVMIKVEEESGGNVNAPSCQPLSFVPSLIIPFFVSTGGRLAEHFTGTT